eukprot:CAMPEP_0119570096 /NCGR_PEP_ID=MMETSP1352-20130426/43434_1 /TAXON_ID=265584 /ORGANISM="Stauroneis constricta, Strain CCMP1120" /LENGTH=642 /DNA_ID=CAMNT_0007619761 /DNA_START=32 /DNA_END=1960 /DNA_ORIENTATION=+
MSTAAAPSSILAWKSSASVLCLAIAACWSLEGQQHHPDYHDDNGGARNEGTKDESHFFFFHWLGAKSGVSQQVVLVVATALCAAFALYIAERRDRQARIERNTYGRPMHVNPFVTGSIKDSLGYMCMGNVWYLLKQQRIPHTNRPDVMGEFSELRDAARERGCLASRMWIFHPWNPLSRAMVVIHDVELVTEVLSRKQYGKWKKGLVYEIAAPLVGTDTILSAVDGDCWRHQRKIVSAGFCKEVLQAAYDTIHTSIERLSVRWDELVARKKHIDILDEMMKLTMEVIGQVAFSYDFESCVSRDDDTKSVMAQDFELILRTLTTRARGSYLIAWVPTPENLRFNKAITRLDGVVNDIISRRNAHAGTDKQHHHADVLSLMLADDHGKRDNSNDDDDGSSDDDSKKERDSKPVATNNSKLTAKQIADNIKTLLFAGHDTTASALAWAIYHISIHPNVEQRLLDEFKSSSSGSGSGSHTANSTPEELERLPYLGAVVKETLRLHASGGLARRPVSKDGERIGGLDIPNGDEIFIVPHLIHRDPRYWDNPDDFIPERWLDSDPKKQRGIYLPFSLGPRNCVGQKLALLELRTVLKLVLQRYRFRRIEGEGVPQVVTYLTFCPNRIRMGIELRGGEDMTKTPSKECK